MTPRQRVFVGAEAFVDALRADLESCERSLRVQFSTFEGDEAGQAFAELLIDRASAGVEVQVILDGYSDVIADDVYPFSIRGRSVLKAERQRRVDLLAKIEAAGVPIRRVNPAGRLHRYILFRDHKKMVIIDDAVAYVGGLNISAHNYGWHDFMVRVDGPVIEDVVTDFTSTWAGETATLTQRHAERDYALNHSPGRPTAHEAALELIDGARERILMESPYLCGEQVETALLRAAERGVHITLVTPLHPNHLHNRIWCRKLRRRLRHANIDVLGYRDGDGMTHAKLLVIDGTVASFGSLNYQEIEATTQKELNIFTRDRALIDELSALGERDVAASGPVPRPWTSFGWWTYRLLHGLIRLWTKRLLRRAGWRATYT